MQAAWIHACTHTQARLQTEPKNCHVEKDVPGELAGIGFCLGAFLGLPLILNELELYYCNVFLFSKIHIQLDTFLLALTLE